MGPRFITTTQLKIKQGISLLRPS